MKVFISHKQEDSVIASELSNMLRYYGIEHYLDVLDSQIVHDPKLLTEHIKKALNTCTDILVIMSESTRFSQWVPFEIGMAHQRNMPTVTYLKANVPLPDFLQYWPRLKNPSDIVKYINTRCTTKEQMDRRYGSSYTASTERAELEMRTFYDNLKNALR